MFNLLMLGAHCRQQGLLPAHWRQVSLQCLVNNGTRAACSQMEQMQALETSQQ